MDGDPAQRATAYTACGEVVVHQSDVLCVVWDGERRQRPGGTEYALDYATAMNVPVVWIDARAPHHWRIVRNRADITGSPARPTTAGALSEVRELVLRALQLPAPERGSAVEENKSPGVEGFYREQWPGMRARLGLPWRLFIRSLGAVAGTASAVPDSTGPIKPSRSRPSPARTRSSYVAPSGAT